MSFRDDEEPPAASNKVNGAGLVKINTPTCYSKDNVALTADTVTAVVELIATSSTVAREGLDLVAVLDVSGSMKDGGKLTSMRKAMNFVIMKLTPLDRLSVVIFNGSATRRCPLRTMTPAAQNDLSVIVDGLVPDGGTNIKAGMETGLAVLKDRVHTKARTANIFLLSDGKQTDGDAAEVDPGLVGVYTFGLGKDANHSLLSAVAKRSPGGTFSSVPDGGNVSSPFSQLLAGLLTVVAQDVELTLTPNSDGGDLATMAVAPGMDYTQTTNGATGVITIKFGTLFSGETRKVAVNMTLADSTDDDETGEDYDAELAEAGLSYTAQKAPHQDRQTLRIERNPNPKEEPSRKAQAVLAEMARRNHAMSISAARALADRNDLDGAQRELAKAQNAVENIMLDNDPGERFVSMLRAELLQLLAFMDTQELYSARGSPYALASETSHGRQRYAARGGDMDDAVRLFATARMDRYLEQAKQFEKDHKAALPSADDDVKEEMAANPLAAISAPLAFYLKSAIEALQAIEKIIAATAT